MKNVLFLCTGNSARNIIAEAVLARAGAVRFNAFSAGSMPNGKVHPFALDLLKLQNFPTDKLRSQSWDEFAVPDAPVMYFVFTVCENARDEACPVWPGQPVTAHWGILDPATVDGSEAVKRDAFAQTMRDMTRRVSLLVNLPLDRLDNLSLSARLDNIGRTEDV